MARYGYIEFYYSTKHKPEDKYKCDNANVLNLLKSVGSHGVETAAIDLGDNPDPFRSLPQGLQRPRLEVSPHLRRGAWFGL